MIRTDAEFRLSVARLESMDSLLKEQQIQFKRKGYDKTQIKRLLDPMRGFQAQIREEIALYERLKRGEVPDVFYFDSIGKLLIAIRIAKGVTQRDLAERLNVSESQISRDERNSYFAISTDRVQRILDVLGAEIKTSVIWKDTAKVAKSGTKAKPRAAAKSKASRSRAG